MFDGFRRRGRRARRRLAIVTVVCCLSAIAFTWFGRSSSFGWNTLPPVVSIAAIVVWWALFLRNLRFLTVLVETWLAVLAYFRGRPPVVSTIRLVARSRIAARRLAVIACATAVVLIAFHDVPFVVPMALVLPWKMLAGLSDAVQPPTILVLANSNEKALWLQERVSGEVVPHRVMSLLRLTENEEWQRRNTHADIARTRPDADWRAVVGGLLEIVPIVMFDVRTETDFVREEADEIRRLALEYKVLFVIGGGRPAPLAEGSSAAAFAHDWGVSGFLWYVTNYRRVRPSPELSLNRLYRDFIDHVVLAGGHGTEELSYLESILDRT